MRKMRLEIMCLTNIFDENNEKFLKFLLATQIGCIRPI